MDCWANCIQRVTGLAAVPDFVNEDGEYWLANTGIWLYARGWSLFALVPVQDQCQADVSKLATPIGQHVAVGLTAEGGFHAVVVGAGGDVWDPDDESTGLTIISGRYWVLLDA